MFLTRFLNTRNDSPNEITISSAGFCECSCMLLADQIANTVEKISNRGFPIDVDYSCIKSSFSLSANHPEQARTPEEPIFGMEYWREFVIWIAHYSNDATNIVLSAHETHSIRQYITLIVTATLNLPRNLLNFPVPGAALNTSDEQNVQQRHGIILISC